MHLLVVAQVHAACTGQVRGTEEEGRKNMKSLCCLLTV